MKVKLLIAALLLCNSLFAQSPYDEIGRPTKMLTLTKGLYPEYHPNDSLQKVGSVIVNTHTKKVVRLLTDEELKHEPETSSRWWAVDPYADKYASYSPYNFTLNNPIKYTDEQGNFVVDPELKKAYPKVALILENADKLYNHQELPADVKKALRGIDVQKVFNDKFRPALEKYSTLNNEQIQDVVKPGSGPKVQVKDLDDPFNDKEVNGKTETFNGTNANNGKGLISIDDDIVQVLEFELAGKEGQGETPGLGGFAGHAPSKSGTEKAVKAFVSTLFHEVVHFGRFKTGAGNNPSDGEQGKAFEKEVYGKDVPRLKKDGTTSSHPSDDE